MFVRVQMQHRIVVNPVIIPDQVILSLVVMEYSAVITPAYLRVVIRLDIAVPKVLRFNRQRLQRNVD